MSSCQRLVIALVLVGAAALASAPASGEVIPAQVVVLTTDPIGGSTVSGLNAPFTDGNGRVGFVGSMADAQRFIWWDTGPVFFSNDALPDVLTGSESTMGVSDDGGFIYSPSFNGNDAVYSDVGKILAKGDPMPVLPGLGPWSSFNSRPTMNPDGTAYWIAGTSDTQGGSSSNRHLLKAVPPYADSTFVRMLGGGDVIEGKTIRTTASNFDYDISDNNLHHIHVLDMNVTLNEHLYVDGAFVAVEGSPTGQGDNWAAFDNVSINNDGHYIFTGDTDGATGIDEFVAYDGEIKVREGDDLDEILLPPGATLRAASLNNRGQVAHIWGASTGGAEWLFVGDGATLGLSMLVLAVGDSLDTDDDGFGEYAVLDFNASGTVGPGLDFADNGYVFVDVDLGDPAGSTFEAVIRVTVDATSAVAGPSEVRGFDLRVVPNPMTDAVRILGARAFVGTVALSIHDVAGRRVRMLAPAAGDKGPIDILWDGRNDAGERVSAGTYFVRAEAEEGSHTARLTVVR